jgi:hypothetical protein
VADTPVPDDAVLVDHPEDGLPRTTSPQPVTVCSMSHLFGCQFITVNKVTTEKGISCRLHHRHCASVEPQLRSDSLEGMAEKFVDFHFLARVNYNYNYICPYGQIIN